MIRVLIVEDQRMAREDMENYIQSSGRYCLAASITNAAMAETVCRQSKCELVLIGYESGKDYDHSLCHLWRTCPV